MGTTIAHENEVTILARVFCDERGQLSREIARHILDIGFSDRDKARMHDLAVRNQDDDLSLTEKRRAFLRSARRATCSPSSRPKLAER